MKPSIVPVYVCTYIMSEDFALEHTAHMVDERGVAVDFGPQAIYSDFECTWHRCVVILL